MSKILVVDHNVERSQTLLELLITHNFDVIDTWDFKEAKQLYKTEMVSAVLIELKLPGQDGMNALSELQKINPDVPIIMLAEFADIPGAVKSIKSGAYDFIVMPPKADRLVFTLQRAIEKHNLNREVKRLNTTVESSMEQLLGVSDSIKTIINKVHQLSTNNFSVVIQGETGTGKSYLAQIIHNMSQRSKQPFVKVDIGAMPDTLVESELFGHERGAFTGADKKKKGYFEAANLGTIFIDELENMSLYVQTKLLSVVELKEVIPLGNTKPVSVDVRVIVATNTDLKKSVAEKKFREDLYYRLCEYVIILPPLRERPDDIIILAKKFLAEAKSELNRGPGELSDEAKWALIAYAWPGNVRELKNVIRRASLQADGDIIGVEHIEFLHQDNEKDHEEITLPLKELTSKAIRDVEIKAIKKALKITKGNKTRAAQLLKISYRSFYGKMKEYDIEKSTALDSDLQ
ncbi:MAG: sigma-54 dependent transcriptional regulator [Spirochaetota bacterium]|nr:sigma-54 dependent transcriptional regulator [Spirochaetota bacterium]